MENATYEVHDNYLPQEKRMNKRTILLSVVGLVFLLGAIFAGLTFSGPLGQTEDEVPIPDHLERIEVILRDQDGDDKELATVEGNSFTARQLRVAYESHMITEADLTEEEAIKATILHQVDSLVLMAEAASRGLETTGEEAKARVAQNKASCEIDEETEAECRENLSRLGFDYDEYWDQLVPVMQEDRTALKAMDALREEYLASEDTDAEGDLLDWLAIHEVRESAAITWHDEDVEALFEEAHRERTDHLEQAK